MGIINAIRASYGALYILSGLSGFLNLFCRRFDRRANCAARAGASLPPGLLNGQALPPLSTLPYGAWRMGSNGCEVIAAYNALLLLGRPAPLPELAEELEARGLLFNGFGGTNLAALPKLFRRRGLTLTLLRRRDRADYDAALGRSGCAVLAYWTGPTLRRPDGSWNTLHTVTAYRGPEGIRICNAYGGSPTPCIAPSLEGFLRREEGVPVCLMALGPATDG